MSTTPLPKMRDRILSKLPEIIVAFVFIAILAALAGWGVSALIHESTTQSIAAGEYVLVFNDKGYIVGTTHGPADVDREAEVLKEPKALNGSTEVTKSWYLSSTATINGEQREISSQLTASVSFDEAVTYFNEQVDAENSDFRQDVLFWWSGDNLQTWILEDVKHQLDAAAQAGTLQQMQYATDGLPSLALDEEVLALYTTDLAAQAIMDADAATFDARKAVFLDAIDEVCQKFPDANEFSDGLCPEPTPVSSQENVSDGQGTYISPNPGSAPPPVQTRPGDPGTSGGSSSGEVIPPPDDWGYYEAPSYTKAVGDNTYDFGCATYSLVLTNGDVITQTINSTIQAELVHVTATQKMDLIVETAQPCALAPGQASTD